MIEFPEDFLWGAAASSYQVEGNNVDSDWWAWEKKIGLKENSGAACRHYEFYEQDFDLAKSLNHNAHRLSIEWSRIEPCEGKFSQDELRHYLDVIIALKQRNIEPIVTLHHFSNPLWLARLGGWENVQAHIFFLRYTEKILQALAEHVRYWVTINEPLVYAYHAYILGVWPPQEQSLLKARIVINNLAVSHIKAYKLIHEIYAQKKLPAPYVSIAKNLQAFAACTPALKNRISVWLKNKFYNFSFIERLLRANALDFIGINYYNRTLVDAQGWHFDNLLLDTCKKDHSRLKKNSLGWDIYPQGLYYLLMRLKRYNLPVVILENGICHPDDSQRWDFISEHLKNIHLALSQGVQIKGYIYWSLIDNFEWDKGFAPRFGLIEVDYHTYERTVRESARKYALVCGTGKLE